MSFLSTQISSLASIHNQNNNIDTCQLKARVMLDMVTTGCIGDNLGHGCKSFAKKAKLPIEWTDSLFYQQASIQQPIGDGMTQKTRTKRILGQTCPFSFEVNLTEKKRTTNKMACAKN